MEMRLPQDFKEFLQLLNMNQVEVYHNDHKLLPGNMELVDEDVPTVYPLTAYPVPEPRSKRGRK